MKTIATACIILLCLACNRAAFKPKWTNEIAPSTYTARFETTKGSFDVRVTKSWSPLAADRFYQLVKHRVYDSAIFYRVIPNFVAQFSGKDWSTREKWMKYKIADEQVVHGNNRGTLSFAISAKETRGDALFINLKDNPHLDTINLSGVTGFPAFGEVVRGMEVVDALYSNYGDNPRSQLQTMYTDRSKFFNLFPALDVVKRAYILKN